MKIIKNKSKDDLIKSIADLFIYSIENLAKEQETISIGLVGGRSVVPLYQELAKINSPAWEKCHFFIVDERYVPIDDNESNYKLCKDILLNPLLHRNQIQDKYIHPMRTELSGDDTAKDYSEQFEKYAKKLDIAILSTGEDGHVGGIFPNKEYSNNTYDYFEDSPKMPPKRISITPNNLSETRIAFTLFLGEGKKDALNKFLNKQYERTTPQKVLDNIKDLIVVTDQIDVK